MKILMRREDGTTYHVEYKPTSQHKQEIAVRDWLLSEGGRKPSEAAMEMGTMSFYRLHKLYRNLVITGKVKQ